MKSDLSKVKVGDILIVRVHNSRESYTTLKKVVRTTMKQFMLDAGKNYQGEQIEDKFWKENGGEVGSGWYTNKAFIGTMDEMAEVSEGMRKRNIVVKSRNFAYAFNEFLRSHELIDEVLLQQLEEFNTQIRSYVEKKEKK